MAQGVYGFGAGDRGSRDRQRHLAQMGIEYVGIVYCALSALDKCVRVKGVDQYTTYSSGRAGTSKEGAHAE